LSRGRLILSHTRSRLSAQTTHSVLCLGSWCHLGLVKDCDLDDVAKLQELDGEAVALPNGWDAIEKRGNVV
jgi:hypothetical protein